MKVYVAGAVIHKEEIRHVQSKLREIGCTITHDWTVCEPENACPTEEELRTFSRQDIGGVRAANVVVVVLNDPTYAYRGTFAELGAAIAFGKTIYIIDSMGEEGKHISRHVFCNDDAVRMVVHSVEQLIKLLVEE